MTTPDVRSPHAVRDRVAHLRLALMVAAVVFGGGAVVGFLARDAVGALGVATGVALVTVSYVTSTLAIAWADSVSSRLVFPVGMAMYVTKFSLFGAMLIFVGATDWAGKIPMALGIVAGVVAWTAAQIWWTVRHEHPYVASAR